MLPKRLIQSRPRADDPAMQRGMINDDIVLGHHLFQLTQAQGISQIPANTMR